MVRAWPLGAALVASLVVGGCQRDKPAPEGGQPAGASAAAVASASTATRHDLPTRQGGALARAPDGNALWLADEDHRVLRRIPLPIEAATMTAAPGAQPAPGAALSRDLPGPPAQVLPLADRVLVTIRDPGLLLILRREASGGLVEEGRVDLPPDAWGLAVTPDEKLAAVSYTHLTLPTNREV